MRATYPIPLNEQLTGTLSIALKVGKETAIQAQRLGIEADELENLLGQRLQEIVEQLGDLLGLEPGG